MYRIGIDIGGTKINIGLFNNEKKLISNKKVPVSDISDLSVFIKDTVDELCDIANIRKTDIVFCGIGIPGTVSKNGRKIVKVPNIEILNENITEEIEEKINIPVKLVQDSRAAAWGEYLFGAGKEMNTLVCITIGTGIGTGIVIDGKIYNGALGGAGEIGHLPLHGKTRKCGCGKEGCLEKYCAGGGLDITAKELYGENATAYDLFLKASEGDMKAKEKLDEATSFFGNALVGIVNLLSPDMILFSGGLCNQEKLYVNPLIEYIQKHCYSYGKIPILKKALLGENAPMYGAAFISYENRSKKKGVLSASIMCADMLDLKKSLKEIENSGIEYIHCDIMDNHFVPNLMLPPEILNKIHYNTNLPFDYHIMAEKPETVIEMLDIKVGDIVSVHYESTKNLNSVLQLIKKKGAKVCVAINPATPINVLEEVVEYIDYVLVMTVNPGFASQKIVSNAFDKIKRTREFLNKNNCQNVVIEVDGNCSFENIPKMYNAGAEMFVVGTSSVFKENVPIAKGVEKIHELLDMK